MLIPFYVIKDQRPLWKRIVCNWKQKCAQPVLIDVPQLKPYKRYVTLRTKLLLFTTMTMIIGAVAIFTDRVLMKPISGPPKVQIGYMLIDSSPVSEPIYNDFVYQNDKSHGNDHKLDYDKILKDGIEKQELCLTKNIYYEARSEPFLGQIAVGLVTLNRVVNDRFPDTVCGVVWQNSQFSWTNNTPKNQTVDNQAPSDKQAWINARLISKYLLTRGTFDIIDDFTHQSIFYHASYASPFWIAKKQLTTKIGTHYFYRDKQDDK